MSFNSVRTKIAGMVQAAIAAEGITEPMEYPNIKFKRPAEGAWMRLTIRNGRTNPIAIGSAAQRLNRTPIVVLIQVFIPEEEGSARAHEIADAFARQLDYQDVSTEDIPGGTKSYLSFRTFGLEPIGVRDGFDQYNLSCEVRMDSVASDGGLSQNPDVVLWAAPDSVVSSGGVITTLVDKGPNGNDFTQPLSVYRPTLYADAAIFNGAQYAVLTLTLAQPFTIIFRGTLLESNTIGVGRYLFSSGDFTGFFTVGFTSGKPFINAGTEFASATVLDSTEHTVAFIADGANSKLIIDDGETETGDPGTEGIDPTCQLGANVIILGIPDEIPMALRDFIIIEETDETTIREIMAGLG